MDPRHTHLGPLASLPPPSTPAPPILPEQIWDTLTPEQKHQILLTLVRVGEQLIQDHNQLREAGHDPRS
jgi:hypothetical protein